MQSLLRHLFVVAVFASASAFAQNETIVIDEPDAAFTGNWQSLKESTSAGVSPTFRFSMNTDEAQPTATATFRPKNRLQGRYNVEIASSAGGNRSPKVPCVISCADGEIPVVVDQTFKNGWHRVADNLPFNTDTDAFVRILNNCGHLPSGKIVIADAVRFVPVGANDTQTFQLGVSATDGGSVRIAPRKNIFEPKSVATVTAEPKDGFAFTAWTGDISSTENPLRITMDKNIRLTAHFSESNLGAILDASDAAFTGSWLQGAPKWGARTNYQFAPTCAQDGALATATYQPQLSSAGLYDIYIWYSKGTNRADNAPWEIVGKNKSFTVKVNQKENGGNWFSIASAVEFEAGKNGYVKVSNMTGNVNSVVVADSVAFVYVGKPE